MIVAVDFDMTLSMERYPMLGKPNRRLFEWLVDRKINNGDKIILWTCREGKQLVDAINYCREQGLEFDAINQNVPEVGYYSRKIVADLYIDDHAARPEEITNIPRKPIW